MHLDLHPPLVARSTCLVATALGLAFATGAPSTAEPPRSDIQSVGDVAAAERRSPATGLVTARAPDVLREQLGLERGAGLVVEAVAVGSRAERAGLKRHDVLVSLDDQLLVLPEQLATLVAASLPDATLVIDVRRGGKSLEIVLGLSPAPTLPQSIPAGPEPPAPQTPDRVPATVPRKQRSKTGTILRHCDHGGGRIGVGIHLQR
jgi:predicted metalloprotease with PDZ domain